MFHQIKKKKSEKKIRKKKKNQTNPQIENTMTNTEESLEGVHSILQQAKERTHTCEDVIWRSPSLKNRKGKE